MPRGQVQAACDRCRKKRAKCDGQVPCRRCREVGDECEYEPRQHVSKSGLRAEIEHLRGGIAERDDLIRNLTAGRGLETPLTGLRDTSDFTSPQGSAGSRMDIDSSTTASDERVRRQSRAGSSSFNHLFSWSLCLVGGQSHDELIEPSEDTTILSLPPLPLDAYTSISQPDLWTDNGWTQAHIRHLFDVLLTWDYLPFSLLCKDEFLQDYYGGSRRFCSSSLVHALLALSSRLVNEVDDDTNSLLPSGWLSSKFFCDKTERLLQQNDGMLDNLPDIQALGILSLYHLRCGQEAQAYELAELFSTKMTAFSQRHVPMGEQETLFSKVRATTYSGALSLIRILHLTTGLIFNMPSQECPEAVLFLDDILSSSTGDSQSRFGLGLEPFPLHIDLQPIIASVLQLTEWVYNFVIKARSESTISAGDAEAVYFRCLDWYEKLFAVVNHHGTRTPFILFIHMYYHFCLLCAFRPVISMGSKVGSIHPRKICGQAAQSILALAQAYDDLFTLRRVSALIPYFICASGLYGLSMEDSGSPMEPVHLRRSDYVAPAAQSEQDPNNPSAFVGGTSLATSHVKMPATRHARLLLAKISSTHLVVTRAEALLGGGDQFRSMSRE